MIRFFAFQIKDRGGAPGSVALTGILWCINLASISASVLVYVYLAHYAYRSLNSVLLSEFALLAPMVMPVLLVFQLHRIASRIDARRLLLGANLLGAVTCALLFLGPALAAWSLLLGAGVVGALDALQRIARMVAIKRYFAPGDVARTVPLTLTAQFIAGALAGAVIAFFPGQMTNTVAAGASITLMLIAASCAALLPKISCGSHTPAAAQVTLVRWGALIKGRPALKESLLEFVILASFFQGFYSISRVMLPAYHLGLEQGQVGVLQILASLSAVAGALTFYFLSRRGFSFKLPMVVAACAAAMVMSCVARTPAASFSSYFVYFFLFELAFFKLQAEIMAATPAPDMPVVAAIQYALVYAGMMLAIALGAILVVRFGLTCTAVVFVAGFYLSRLACRLFLLRPALSRSAHP